MSGEADTDLDGILNCDDYCPVYALPSATGDGRIEDPIGSIQGASIAPAAVLVTIQFPKVSLGVGFALARASAYISAVYSFSPLVSGVTNITPCRAAPLNIVVKAGYTAEFLGHEVAAADRKLGEVSASPIDPPIKACEF